ILARQARDRRARAADPLPLDHGDALARTRKMPGQQLASLSTSENQRFESFWFTHASPPSERASDPVRLCADYVRLGLGCQPSFGATDQATAAARITTRPTPVLPTGGARATARALLVRVGGSSPTSSP